MTKDQKQQSEPFALYKFFWCFYSGKLKLCRAIWIRMERQQGWIRFAPWIIRTIQLKLVAHGNHSSYFLRKIFRPIIHFDHTIFWPNVYFYPNCLWDCFSDQMQLRNFYFVSNVLLKSRFMVPQCTCSTESGMEVICCIEIIVLMNSGIIIFQVRMYLKELNDWKQTFFRGMILEDKEKRALDARRCGRILALKLGLGC